MTCGLHRLRSHPWLALALMLPGLLLRAAVPPGFMPAAPHGAAFTVEMCPGHSAMPAPREVPADAPGNDGQRQPNGAHHDRPCLFAAATGLAPLPFQAGDISAVDAFEDPPPSPHVAPVSRPAVRANAPRAPPARA